MRYTGKIYYSKNKGLAPGAWCLIREEVAQLHLSAEESPHSGTARPSGQVARTQSCNMSVSHFPISPSATKASATGCERCYPSARTAATPRPTQLPGVKTHLGPWLSSDCVSLGLGRSKLPFKLSSLLPNSSWACAGVFSYPIPFLGLWGFVALILPDPFPRLSQARLLSLWSPCGFYCACLEVLLHHLAFIAHALGRSSWLLLRLHPAKEFPLSGSQRTPFPNWPVVPLGNWKAGLSCSSRINILLT